MDTWYFPSLISLIVLALVIPVWPHSKGWTWAPAGMIGMIAGIIIAVTSVSRVA